MEKIMKENTFMENKDGNTNNSNTNVHNNKGETKNEEKKYGFRVESARDIQDAEYDGKDFIIDGLITPGLNLLAGYRKQGKSMLALNMALCIAGDKDFWGMKTEHGKVLYMMLEDTRKRTKDRINRMLDYADAPESLKLAYAVNIKGPDLNKGIEAFIQENPDTKTVIIDVLEKIRTSKPGNKSEYSHDYDEIGALQKIANKYGIAIIVVTHCRKTRDSNWVNEISGGVGVTGAADTILRLKKAEDGGKEGKLLIIGRDVPEKAFAARLDDKPLWWGYAGTADEQELAKDMELYNSSPVVRAIKLLLEKNHGHWSGTCSELLGCGMEELGEPLAQNVSALGRKINEFDGLFQRDCIIHTKPGPNGGTKGRVHHFRFVESAQQPQEGPPKVISMGLEAQALPEEELELPF